MKLAKRLLSAAVFSGRERGIVLLCQGDQAFQCLCLLGGLAPQGRDVLVASRVKIGDGKGLRRTAFFGPMLRLGGAAPQRQELLEVRRVKAGDRTGFRCKAFVSLMLRLGGTSAMDLLVALGDRLQNCSDDRRAARRGTGPGEKVNPRLARRGRQGALVERWVSGVRVEEKLQNPRLNGPTLEVRRIGKLGA